MAGKLAYWDLISKWSRSLVMAVSVWYLTIYLILALFRLPYPFAIEWREGFGVDVVIRIPKTERSSAVQ